MLFPTRLCSFRLMLRLNHQVLSQSLETLVSSCQPWLATVCDRALGGNVPLLSPSSTVNSNRVYEIAKTKG